MAGGRREPAGSRLATVAALAVVVVAPLVPGVLSAGSPAALAGLPVEAIAVVLLLLALPARRARIAVAALFGGVVVAAAAFAALDAGFRATVDRPFSAADDWPQLGAAVGVVADAITPAGAVAAVVGLVALLVAVAVGLAAAALRAGRAAHSSGRQGRLIAATLASAWILAALLGAHPVPGVPLAAADAADTIATTSSRAVESVRDRQEFERALRSDAAASLPPSSLLAALHGKTVVVAFLESYGRSAVEGSTFSPGVDAALAQGQAVLDRTGYTAESAFLDSPTFGGVSWLAHSTLQSGVWIDSQQKYDRLTTTGRLTLARAFGDAGWRTVAVVPSNKGPWQVGSSFYGYDEMFDSRTLGYRGPAFSYARVPDQFTWQTFHDRELTPGHAPLMAEIDFVSSHTPWTPLPSLVPWSDLGDGSVFTAQAASGEAPVVAWQDPKRVQQLYGESVQYTLGALFSYLETYGTDDLVLVVLGDHQPARIVSGAAANHDVPITIIAKDPTVFASISSWGWDAGVRPSSDAPVWRMDAFRDRFLAAFSPGSGLTG
ncbi:CDP-alcohol phosphatidyltransferase [Microbacterium sp. B2969]|uniref:CDP-alcohol phosphatidyltransferase n=1 Tax=Microbacterium alkaliflavum TaxID=3248839 RepID=A0ABW7QAE9_9MICO